MLTLAQQALWANSVQRDCLLEAGDDVDAGLAAAEIILSTQPFPAALSQEDDQGDLRGVVSIDAFFAHDIYNRKAQGILNRSLQAAKRLTAAARKDLATALKAKDSGASIVKFIERYRLQLAKLLTTTQLASVLEGAREVAKDVPTLAIFPGAVPPPPSLEPKEAVALVDRLEQLTETKRAEEIYKLTPAEQQYVVQTIAAKQAGPVDVPPIITTTADAGDGGVHLPTIDEAVKQLAEKNVMTRDTYDALDAAAKAKAFAVAGVDASDTLTKIRDALAENVRKGADYETFEQEVMAAVDQGTFMSDNHLETIFRTNVQSAFSDGQMTVLQHPLVRSGFPYAAYYSIHNDRVRKEHKHLDTLGIGGTNVYRVDDPVFQTFRPPWSYQCRCSWAPLTIRHASELGIKEAAQWLDTGVEPSPPAYVPMPDFAPLPGFQRTVSSATMSIRLSLQPMATFAVDDTRHTHKSTESNDDERATLIADILVAMFGDDAEEEAKKLADDVALSAAFAVGNPKVKRRYGAKPGPNWTAGGTSSNGKQIWVWGAASSPVAPAAPTPAPTPPPAPVPPTPAPALRKGGQQARASSIAAHTAAMAKLNAGQQLTTTEKAALAKKLSNMPTPLLHSLHTALGGSGSAQRPTVVASVKAILASSVSAPPAPTPPPALAPTPLPASTVPLPSATPPAPSAAPAKPFMPAMAPTGQAPINLKSTTAPPPLPNYKGMTASQIDPTWAGLDQPGVNARFGAVVLRVDPVTGKQQVLLAKPKGYFSNVAWTFAKGGADPNEDPVAAAQREASEEAGAKGDIIGHLSGTYAGRGDLTGYFLMHQTGPIDDTAWKANGESADVQWADLDQAAAMINQTAQNITDANGTKTASWSQWQRDIDVLEQTKEAVLLNHKAQPVRRVDALPINLQNASAQIRASAIAVRDGVIKYGQGMTDIQATMAALPAADQKLLAGAFQTKAGGTTPQDFIKVVGWKDPGHVGPSPPGPPPRPGLIWNPTTHRWILPPSSMPPLPGAAGATPPVPAQATPAAPTPPVASAPLPPKTWAPGGKTITTADREDLDLAVAYRLKQLGITAKDALKSKKTYAIQNLLSSDVDSSVGSFEVERTLKNLYAQEAKVPIAAQFPYMGGKRGQNYLLPNESRPTLTKPEQVAAQKWTSTAFIPWAKSLRETGLPPAQYAKEDADLQKAFAKVQAFSSPVRVNRLINLDDSTLATFLAQARASESGGAPVTYAGYQGAATGAVPSIVQGNVEMRINAVHGLDLKPYTHHPHMTELLLNHNSQYKVTGVNKVGNRWVIDYDQLPPGTTSAVVTTSKNKTLATPAAGAPKKFTDMWQVDAVKDFLNGGTPMTSTLSSGAKEYTLLNAILHEAGRDTPPQVLDTTGIDALKSSGWKIGFRSVNGKQYLDKFRYDPHYKDAGGGARVYGMGTYFAAGGYSEDSDKRASQGYGSDTMRVAIDPKIKMITAASLKGKQNIERRKIKADSSLSSYDKRKRLEIVDDNGLFAALHNYDAVKATSNYVVMLNRTKVAVQKDNV